MAEEFRYPFDRERQLPELAEIVSAISKADAPEENSRDVRPLMSLLQRLPAVDPALPETKPVANLLSAEWTITPTREEFADDAEIARERLKEAIYQTKKTWIETRHFGKWGLKLEWAQQEWSTRKSSTTEKLWTPVTATKLEQTDFEAHRDYERGITLLEHTKSKFTRKEPKDTTKESYLTDTFRLGIAGGVYRSVLIYEWLLYANIQDWRNFLKRLRGLIVASYADGGAELDSPQQKKAEKAVREAGAVNWVAASNTLKFEFLKIVDSLGAKAHEDFDKMAQEKINIALCGTANSSNLADKGSRSAQETMIYGVEESLAFLNREDCQRVINQQLIQQDIERNYKTDNQMAPYSFQFLPRFVEDRESNARIATMLLGEGVPLLKKEVAEKTGFTPAVDGEIIPARQGITL